MRLTRGITATGSTNCGARDQPGQARRPPKLRGNVANDVSPVHPRSAIMPPPTTDTSQPYRSKSGATTSPSNTIRTTSGHSAPRGLSVSPGGNAAPFVSKTPSAAPAGKYPRGKR